MSGSADTLKDVGVLVTGGAGFIGSHLVARLLSEGARVTCLDNLSTGYMANVADVGGGHSSFRFIEGDIRDTASCDQALEGIRIVLHQAALGSVPRSFADPAETLAANLVGTAVLYLRAKEMGVEKFIYASSSSVYGDAEGNPKKEGEEGAPLSPYAVSKAAADELMGIQASREGPRIVGLRYFNVFGPRQHPHGAYAAMIPRFILSMLRDEQPTVFGDGEQTRDFTHVENIVSANLLAIEKAGDAHGRVINVGCGAATSVNEVASSIHAAVTSLRGSAPRHAPAHAPEREGEVRHSSADISLAGHLLGYRPAVQVGEGLAAAVSWYADHLDRYPEAST